MSNIVYTDNIYNEMLFTETKNRRIHLNEDVTEISIFKMMYNIDKIVRIDELEGKVIKDREPITLIINSYGGQLYECLALLSKIESLQEKGYIIDTELTGKGMSCGQLIFMFGTHRRISRYGTLLIHQLSSWNGGNYSNLKVQFEEDQRLQNLIEELIVKKTNIPLDLLREKIDGKDWYLSAADCLKYGMATEII